MHCIFSISLYRVTAPWKLLLHYYYYYYYYSGDDPTNSVLALKEGQWLVNRGPVTPGSAQ